MPTKRIDLRVNNGSLEIISKDNTMEIIKNEFGNYKVKGGPWTIKVNKNFINIHCKSKAVEKRRRFSIPFKNCSLFLHSSTTDWHWFIREEKFQSVLDRLNITTLEIIDKPECVVDTVVGVIDNRYRPIKYCGDVANIHIEKKLILENGISLATAKFIFEKFLLIEYSPEYRVAYLCGCKLTDFLREHPVYNSKIETMDLPIDEVK